MAKILIQVKKRGLLLNEIFFTVDQAIVTQAGPGSREE